MARQSGQRELAYITRMDISDLQKKAKESIDLLRKMREEASKAVKVNVASAPSIRPLTNFQQANIALRKTLIEAQAETQRLRQENLALDASYRQGRISAQQAAAEDRRINRERRALAEATRAARQAQVAANGSYDEATRRLRDLGKSIRAAEGGFTSTSPAIRAQIREYNNLNDSLKRFDAQMGNHQRNVGNYKSANDGIIGQLQSMALGYLSLQGAISAANFAFDKAMKFDAVKTSFEFTLKSSDAAEKKISELSDTADRLGLNFEGLSETYASFTGAARAANFSLVQSDRIFNSVSGAAARFHLTNDQLKGSLLAIQQMISKGTVQSEELRGQLGERLPGAFSIAARAMGVTEKELGKLLQTGQVTANDLLPKLASELDRTFSLDKSTKIDSLTASMNRFKNVFTDAVAENSNIDKFFKSFIDGLTGASNLVVKTLNSSSWKEFFLRLNALGSNSITATGFTAAADIVRDMKTYKKYDSDVDEFVSATKEKQIDLLRTLTTVRDNAYKQAEKGQKSDIAYYNEQQGLLVKLRGLYKELHKEEKAVAVVKKDNQLTSLKEIRARLAELSKLPGSAIDGSDISNRIKALQDRLKAKPSDKADLNAREAFEKKLFALHDQSVKKQESSDEQELTSVRLKYKGMREEAEKYYRDNKQPVRDESGRLISRSKVFGRIKADEDAETADVTARQVIKKDLEALDIQKKQFADYEQYKIDFGTEMANKRFSKDIVANQTYLNKLKTIAAGIEIIPERDRTGAQKDQLTEIKKRIDDEVALQANKYDDLLKRLQNFNDEERRITDQYAKDRDFISSNPLGLSPEEVASQFKEAAERYEKAISENTLKQLTESEDWQNLFGDLDQLASGELDRLITTISGKSKELTAKFNPVDLKVIRENLERAKMELISRNPFAAVGKALKAVFSDGADGAKKSSKEIKENWDNLAKSTATAFQFVDNAVQSTNILRDALGEVGSVAISSLATIATVAATVTTAIKTAEKSSKALAIISAALTAVQAIGNVLGSIFNSGDKRLEKKIKGYKSELDALTTSYKQLEREVSRSVGEAFYTNSAKEIQNLQQQQQKLIQMRDAEASKKKKDQDKITEYQNQINDIPNQIQDIQQSITDMLVQTSFKDLSANLSDALVSAFATGENAIDKLNKTYNDFIGNAVKKGLELKILQPVVDNLINDFASYLQNNNNSAQGFDFDAYREKLKNAGDKFSEGLKPFEEFFKDSTTVSSALNNNIKGITSDQANGLEGILRGSYDIQKQLLAGQKVYTATVTSNHMDYVQWNVAKMRRLEAIEFNTAATVVELKKSNESLTKIVTNTKGSTNSMRDSGFGI